MPGDKSLGYYGRWYHRLMDPLLSECRAQIVKRTPPRARVLDIGCGTGALCFALHQGKGCRVTGIDLSLRMLDFAKAHNRYEEVGFLHRNATDMAEIDGASFDVATVCFLIHELRHPCQINLLQEAWRIARMLILVDSASPLPWNAVGVIKRAIEFGFGREHYPQFRDFVEKGGIPSLLQEAGLAHHIVSQDRFQAECQQVVVVSHAPREAEAGIGNLSRVQ